MKNIRTRIMRKSTFSYTLQGYVTELLLTLESSVDSLDSDFRPLDFMKEIFKSTPNLNKDIGTLGNSVTAGKRLGYGGAGASAAGYLQQSNAHARSTSYSVSHYYTRRTSGWPSCVDHKGTRRYVVLLFSNKNILRKFSATFHMVKVCLGVL